MKYISDAYRASPWPSSIAPYGGTHQSFDRDLLACCDLARERQQRAYELVCEQHALTVARINGRNSTLSDALLRHPKYVADGWVWVYNTAATI